MWLALVAAEMGARRFLRSLRRSDPPPFRTPFQESPGRPGAEPTVINWPVRIPRDMPGGPGGWVA